MSDTVARQRPSVDLDDFERRLRQQQGAQPGRPYDDDPLTELARLVGQQHDPYGDVFAREAVSASRHQGRQEPALGGTPRFSGDFAAIEAGLRGAVSAHPEMDAHGAHDPHMHDPHMYADHDPSYQDQAYQDQAYQQEPYPGAHAEQAWMDPAHQQRNPSRSRRPIYAMVATIAVGVIGIGIAFAYKGVSSSPREIKTIMAAAGPTKVQPPADASADQDTPDAGALGKTQAAPTKLVSREEQPVDLSQAVQDNSARTAASQGTDASSVQVPPPPGRAMVTSSPDYSAIVAGGNSGATSAPPQDSIGSPGFGVGMPAPKKVKVVSVRPDGTIMSDVSAPQSSAPMDIAPKAVDTTPAPTTPKATKSTKTTSRVTPKPTTINAAMSPDDSEAVPPPKPAKVAVKKPKPQPQRVASADTGDQQATTNDAAEPKATGGGGFAVQFAAPGTEAEAKAASSKFGQKFADALAGRRLGFHKADSNGRSVYRVRAGGMSKDDAISLCDKVKADGGSCFVAKN